MRRGDRTFPCRVIDLTEKGVRLEPVGTFRVGEKLHLEFALTDTDLLQCTIQVTHSLPSQIGAVIVDIDPDQQERLSTFIEQLNALNMGGI